MFFYLQIKFIKVIATKHNQCHVNITINKPGPLLTLLENRPYNLAHACLRSHRNVISRTPIIVVQCCVSDTIQWSTFIPGHWTCKVDVFMATSLLQQTTIVPPAIGGPKGVPTLFLAYCTVYIRKCTYISWKTSLKSYKKVWRQN